MPEFALSKIADCLKYRKKPRGNLINESGLQALVASRTGIRVRQIDVRDALAIEKAASEIGIVDVLFNYAGYVYSGTILDTTENDWDFSFDLNVKSMYRTGRAFLPGMLKLRRGSIINIASVVA
jgi:2-keto-3-deoxy-L-fuconate dehydrogenase